MSEDGMRDSSFLLPRQCRHVGAPPTCSYMRMQERAGRKGVARPRCDKARTRGHLREIQDDDALSLNHDMSRQGARERGGETGSDGRGDEYTKGERCTRSLK